MTTQDTGSPATGPIGAPELVVVLEPAAARGIAQASPSSTSQVGVPEARGAMHRLCEVLAEYGAALTTLFPAASEERGQHGPDERPAHASPESTTPTQGGTPDDLGAEPAQRLEQFVHVEAPADRLEELADRLRGREGVAGAYVRPAIELPVSGSTISQGCGTATQAPVNTMTASPVEPTATPHFTSGQRYLDAAPAGVGARWAWTIAGGRGAGVRVVDCEHGWQLDHQDLLANNGGVVSGTNNPSNAHGTAVFGILGADNDRKGVTGIVPDAWLVASSWTSQPAATAINEAANRLRPDDFLLLEGQLPGPNRTDPDSDVGLIALEWWPDLFAAIRAASNRDVIVIEAAGNGFQNLDDPVYDRPAAGFPPTWRNPCNPANVQSGAVVVGAGAPPDGFNGSA